MGAIFALATGLCWAAYNLAVRRGMEAMNSGTGYVIVLLLGSLANALFLFLPLPGRGAPMAGGLGLLWFVLAGCSTTLLGRWVYFKSIKRLGPSRASSWKTASPLYTLVLGFFLLGERPGWLGLAGTLAILAGLWFLSREQSQSVASDQTDGSARSAILLGVASGIAFSSGMLLRKAGLNLWPDAAMGNFIGSLSAMAVYLPYALAQGEVSKMLRAPRAGVWAFLLAGCFSALAQLFTFLSLRVSMAATTQVIAALEPMLTMLLSGMVLSRQEGIGARLVGSAALVCCGVMLMTL